MSIHLDDIFNIVLNTTTLTHPYSKDGNNILSGFQLYVNKCSLFDSPPALPYPHYPAVPFYNQRNFHHGFDERAHSTNQKTVGGFHYPHPESSFADLQTFCNQTRQATAYFSQPPIKQPL